MTKVDSSNIFKVGYDPKHKALHIIFNKRKQHTYVYQDVSAARHKAFMNAESFGEYFTKNIKTRYDFHIIQG